MPKYISLVGSVCADAPALVPSMIKNGLLPDILKSLEGRIPHASEIIAAIIFYICQITIH